MTSTISPRSSIRVVVMGVAGSGKSTVGRGLAEALGARFVDADDAHPPANIAKMSAGIALTDDDRWPWLDRLTDELLDPPTVVTCSALRRVYRDRLRRAGDVQFVFLDIDEPTARERVALRQGHFMKAEMVAGQFAALERPADDETDVVTIAAALHTDHIVSAAVAALAARRPAPRPGN